MQSCLICDDHAMMRDALAGAVRLARPGVNISEAEDFPTARRAALTGPDFIVCDLVMPGASPEAGIALVQAAAPAAPLLVVTGAEDDALLLRLLRTGIAGLLPKSSRSAVIGSAIETILAGGRYVPARFADLLDGRRGVRDAPTAHLSPRQAEIIRAMAQGLTNKEIARTLDVSPATVKAHAAAAFLALGAANRAEAVFKAREERLI